MIRKFCQLCERLDGVDGDRTRRLAEFRHKPTNTLTCYQHFIRVQEGILKPDGSEGEMSLAKKAKFMELNIRLKVLNALKDQGYKRSPALVVIDEAVEAGGIEWAFEPMFKHCSRKLGTMGESVKDLRRGSKNWQRRGQANGKERKQSDSSGQSGEGSGSEVHTPGNGSSEDVRGDVEQLQGQDVG
jgi:hypothetical protein